MSVIHKTVLGLEPCILKAARPLCVGEQAGNLTCWYVTGENEFEIFVLPTGYAELPEGVSSYLGTAIMSDGLVWHVFYKEVKK